MQGRNFLFVAGFLAIVACNKPASVDGDIYLVMQNGDVKRGAGNTVRLLKAADSSRAGRDSVCNMVGTRSSELSRHLNALLKRMGAATRGIRAGENVEALDAQFKRLNYCR